MDEVPAVFCTSGPLWDEAWEALRQEMVYRFRFATAEGWDHRMTNPAIGESWMFDGVFYGEHTCDLTGIKCVGWFHNFRHRGVAENGGQRMVRYYLARLDPRTIDGVEVQEPVKTPLPGCDFKELRETMPIHRKVEDTGEPF